jgi:glycosyltransferase involved in cell wall biosynthesis
MAPRIWMDGFALTDAQGTGITTYSRGLAATLRESGARLGLVYGRPLPEGLDPVERELRFFDAMGPAMRSLPHRLFGLARRFGGARALPVPLSGMVETDLAASLSSERFSPANVPPGGEIWNADDLFGRARIRIALAPGMMPLRAVGGAPPALMHWTHAHPIRLAGTRNIYCIHDLLPLRLPWAMPDPKRDWLRTVRAIARTADHIVTVSENSRQDIIRLLGVAESRVTNTHQPVTIPGTPMPAAMAAQRLRGAYGLEAGGYFLFVSSIEPRKNVARLIDAYLATGIEAPLILIGKQADPSPSELRLLTQAGGTASPDGRVRYLGYLPPADVALLMRHARALCFPSLYEGFGLPAVEAMGLGTPVLTSDNSAMPEIVGDAALKVPPTDTGALAQALMALDSDATLRERLAAMGPARAALFSPARYAERLAALHGRLGVTEAA